jgi:hypothetical protein
LSARELAAGRPLGVRILLFVPLPSRWSLFAKRNLVPSKWHSSVAGPAGEELHIDIQVAGMAPELGDYIARCLRQILHVTCVLTTTKAVEP